MEPFIFLAVGMLVMALFLFFAYKGTQDNAQSWSSVAGKLGLHHNRPSNWSLGNITGSMNGMPVEIFTFTRGSGKNKSTYTKIKTNITPALLSGLHIYRETPVFSSIGKFFGGQDIQTGDQVFDDKYIIKATDESAALKFLTSKIRSMILNYDQTVGELDLKATELSYTTRGVLTDEAQIEMIVRSQNRLAVELTRAHQHNTQW